MSNEDHGLPGGDGDGGDDGFGVGPAFVPGVFRSSLTTATTAPSARSRAPREPDSAEQEMRARFEDAAHTDVRFMRFRKTLAGTALEIETASMRTVQTLPMDAWERLQRGFLRAAGSVVDVNRSNAGFLSIVHGRVPCVFGFEADGAMCLEICRSETAPLVDNLPDVVDRIRVVANSNMPVEITRDGGTRVVATGRHVLFSYPEALHVDTWDACVRPVARLECARRGDSVLVRRAPVADLPLPPQPARTPRDWWRYRRARIGGDGGDAAAAFALAELNDIGAPLQKLVDAMAHYRVARFEIWPSEMRFASPGVVRVWMKLDALEERAAALLQDAGMRDAIDRSLYHELWPSTRCLVRIGVERFERRAALIISRAELADADDTSEIDVADAHRAILEALEFGACDCIEVRDGVAVGTTRFDDDEHVIVRFPRSQMSWLLDNGLWVWPAAHVVDGGVIIDRRFRAPAFLTGPDDLTPEA